MAFQILFVESITILKENTSISNRKLSLNNFMTAFFVRRNNRWEGLYTIISSSVPIACIKIKANYYKWDISWVWISNRFITTYWNIAQSQIQQIYDLLQLIFCTTCERRPSLFDLCQNSSWIMRGQSWLGFKTVCLKHVSSAKIHVSVTYVTPRATYCISLSAVHLGLRNM